MSGKSSGWYRRVYQDLSTSGHVASDGTGVDSVVTVPSTKHTIFVQKIHVDVQTDGQDIKFQDDAGTPIVAATVLSTVTGPQTIDFGDRGFALTEGKNLDIVNTATPVYSYSIECYARQTGATAGQSVDRTI